MLNRIVKTFIGVALATALGLAQAPQPQVKDQGEYDLINAIGKETDPAKKVALLDQWTEKYSDTQFKQQRNLNYVQTYLGVVAAALKAGAPADALSAGEKAANTVLEKLDAFFAPDMKPANVSDADWTKAKHDTALQAIAVFDAKKDFVRSEAEYRKVLAANPTDATSAFQLGASILGQKKVDRQPEAIFYIARSIMIGGPGALTDAQKKATQTYLDRVYKNYHGSLDDEDKVKDAASKSPTMPPDLVNESIMSITSKQNQSAADFAAKYPDIMKWRGLKDSLVGAGADELWKQMKDAEVPGLKGHVVDQPSPKDLTVSMDYIDPALAQKAEVTLHFDPPLACKVDPGTEITFAAIPDSYTKEPFMMMMNVEKDSAKEKVKGLPADCFAATEKKKAPVRKKAAVKKK